MLTNQVLFNRVFKLAHEGLGHRGPEPLWAVVVADEFKIYDESRALKYGDISPLKKIDINKISNVTYNIYSNLLFSFVDLGELRPQKIYYSNKLATQNIELLEKEFALKNIELINLFSKEGINLNKAFFYYETNRLPYSKKILHDCVLNAPLRSGFDCVVFDKNLVQETNDDFKAHNQRIPLRVLKCPLGELNFSWKILSDEFRRNTMVLTNYEDMKAHQDCVIELDKRGVALLAIKDFSERTILESLGRFKFISVLFEI